MHGIKIPQYEFALKMQGGGGGGAYARGGPICGTLRYILSGAVVHSNKISLVVQQVYPKC